MFAARNRQVPVPAVGGNLRLSPLITGTKDRAKRNQETMVATLERLATAVEGT